MPELQRPALDPLKLASTLEPRQHGLPVELLFRTRVLPVVTLADPAVALPVAQALYAAGIEVIEITLREAGALDAIESVATLMPQMTVAVGTVRSRRDVEQASEAGASFALSPGSTPSLLTADLPIPLIPGVSTASEAMAAADNGYRVLKLFSASHCGGPEFLKALLGPLPDLAFVPTGGVDAFSAPGYLSLPNVVCVGGSFVASSESIGRGDWAALEREALAAMGSLTSDSTPGV